MFTKQDIERDLIKMGISKGDMVFVRISYKALGKVDGGPKAVIDAILNVIGCNGTLLATAFPQRINSYNRWLHRNYVYKKGMKPSTGAIPSVMSTYPNACFSSNPISPYVVIGNDAEKITSIHTPDAESYAIVKYIIDNYNPKCLRIGGNILDGTTHLALSEALEDTQGYQLRIPEGIYYYSNGKKRWAERSVSKFCYNGFKIFYLKHIKNNGNAVLNEGKIGDGDAVVTSMKETYLIEKKYIMSNPKDLLCDSELCLTCRISFSFSDNSKWDFISKNYKKIFSTNYRMAIGTFKELLKLIILGKKCI